MATILNKKKYPDDNPEKTDVIYLIRERDIYTINETIKAAIMANAVVSDKVESALEELVANINELLGVKNLKDNLAAAISPAGQLDPVTVTSSDSGKAQVKLQPIQCDPTNINPVGLMQTVPRMKNR